MGGFSDYLKKAKDISKQVDSAKTQAQATLDKAWKEKLGKVPDPLKKAAGIETPAGTTEGGKGGGGGGKPAVPKIIGLPPGAAGHSDNMILNSMPVMEITPMFPSDKGMEAYTIFKMVPAWDDYKKIVEAHGITFESQEKKLKVAFVADNFPSDTFTNEYGESFLQGMTDVVSTTAGEIVHMMGGRTAGEAVESAVTRMAGAPGALGGIGKGLQTGVEQMKQLGASLAGEGGAGGRLAQLAGTVGTLLGNNRIDFNQVWKSSGFAPSYSMTVRLFNPYPGSVEATDKYIIAPLCALLALVLPISEDGVFFGWPFYQKMVCPGLLDLPTAAITSMTVIKGGDQQQIAYNQRLGMVDIRMDFISLYSSMIMNETGKNIPHRPTLKSYLETLRGEKPLEDTYSHPSGGNNPAAAASNVIKETIAGLIPNSDAAKKFEEAFGTIQGKLGEVEGIANELPGEILAVSNTFNEISAKIPGVELGNISESLTNVAGEVSDITERVSTEALELQATLVDYGTHNSEAEATALSGANTEERINEQREELDDKINLLEARQADLAILQSQTPEQMGITAQEYAARQTLLTSLIASGQEEIESIKSIIENLQEQQAAEATS